MVDVIIKMNKIGKYKMVERKKERKGTVTKHVRDEERQLSEWRCGNRVRNHVMKNK